ncbi:MAG: hypothetical protein ACLP8B_20985 [Xanthobacteraceae bacterium]
MTINRHVLGAALLSGLLCAAAMPAHALTMQECSAKYKAAKEAGTLGDQKWNDFRKSQCAAEATPAAAPAAPEAAPAPAPKAAAKPAPKTAAAPAAPEAAPAPTGNAVFPTAISPKYSSESAGKGREHTCLDQYRANKETNANGGLKWIMKGGGYYSECNKRLKT